MSKSGSGAAASSGLLGTALIAALFGVLGGVLTQRFLSPSPSPSPPRVVVLDLATLAKDLAEGKHSEDDQIVIAGERARQLNQLLSTLNDAGVLVLDSSAVVQLPSAPNLMITNEMLARFATVFAPASDVAETGQSAATGTRK